MQQIQFAARIEVDDREKKSGVAESLSQRPGVRVRFRRLSIGDYLVDNTLIVERKTLADFAFSVRDGRLFSQCARLVRSSPVRSCLILEGTGKRYPRLAIPGSAFQGALITVALIFGLPIFRSATPEETANLIIYASQQLSRRDGVPVRRHTQKSGSLERCRILMLQGISGVGPAKAATLLEVFGSPACVGSATTAELEAADGIGPTTARRIHAVFQGSSSTPRPEVSRLTKLK